MPARITAHARASRRRAARRPRRRDHPSARRDLAELIEFLSLRLDSLGEWADDEEGMARMTAAARRQTHLQRLVLGDDEGADESDA